MQTIPSARILIIFISVLLAALFCLGAWAEEVSGFSSEEAAYLSTLTFFGESTTAHLKARGVLADGTHTKQVWQDASGTKKLSARLLYDPIIDPETGKGLSPSAMCQKYKPSILVLSFGLNGITEFINDKELYLQNYRKLIETIQTASPSTRILLQSVYPVTADCKTWSVDGKTVSGYTRTLNGWTKALADEYPHVRYIDTASVLTGADGCLVPTYDFSGDGIHLSADAYGKILTVLCREPWIDEGEKEPRRDGASEGRILFGEGEE